MSVINQFLMMIMESTINQIKSIVSSLILPSIVDYSTVEVKPVGRECARGLAWIRLGTPPSRKGT